MGAIQHQVGHHKGRLNGVAGNGNVHHGEGLHRRRVLQRHLFHGGNATAGAGAPGWYIDIAAPGAAMPHQAPLAELGQKALGGLAGGKVVLQVDRRIHHGDRFVAVSGRGHAISSTGSKQRMSRMCPAGSSAQRAPTRMPVRMASTWPASMQWSSGVSAPSSTIRDRKSTRLNSSHVAISYAVFCLKKKTNTMKIKKKTR